MGGLAMIDLQFEGGDLIMLGIGLLIGFVVLVIVLVSLADRMR